MNIVRVVFNKNIVISALVLLSAIAVGRYALSPRQFTVLTDYRFSPDVRIALQKMVGDASLSILNAEMLCKELQKMYPVRAVSIAYKSSLRALVTLQAYIPSAALISSLPGNKEYVLCNEGSRPLVIEKKFYNEQLAAALPEIIIDGPDFEEKRQQAECLECLKDIKKNIFEEYTVTWRSKSEIFLKSLTLPVLIVADSVTIHEHGKIKAAERIYADDSDQYKEGMRADIRLRESIICAPLKRII